MAETLSCLAGTLLPRTLLHTFPDGIPPEARDLQASALEALGSSKEVLEQARCMLGSSDTTSHPQQRRQGLGRKRARFSMKPLTSKESTNAGIKLNIDKLSDPEEYFSAVEKIEIADRELKKLKGQYSTDQLEHDQVAPVRKRRPGILGKIANYKHSFGVDLDRLDGHLSTVEVCKQVAPEVSIDFESEDTCKANSCNAPPESETKHSFSNASKEDGSAIERESGAHHLLNTLLSSFETLDDRDGATFLQEKLQLKEINVERIRLPVTPPAMKKTLNMKERAKKSNKVALTRRSTAHNRSPLASISLLCKKSFQMDPANDPYSSPSPNKGPSSRKSSWKKSVDEVKLSLPRQVDTAVENFDSATLSSADDEAMVDLSAKEVNIDKLLRGNETVESSPKMASKLLDKLKDSPSTESFFSGNLSKNKKQDPAARSKGSRPGKEAISDRRTRQKKTIQASEFEVSPSTESIFSETMDKNEKQTPAALSRGSRSGEKAIACRLPREMTVQASKMSSNFLDKLEVSPSTECIFPGTLDKNEKQATTAPKDSKPGEEAIASRLPGENETVQVSPKIISNFLDKLNVSPSTESILSGTLEKNEKQDTAAPSKGLGHPPDFCGPDGSAKMRNIDNNMGENLVDQESRPEYAEVLHEGSTPVVVTTSANGISEISDVMQVENDELELSISEKLDLCMERPGNETLKSTRGKDLSDSSEYDANHKEPCIDKGTCESEKENPENDVVFPRNSHVSREGNPKAKKPLRRRVNAKSFDKRKSLAEAGTKWEAGLRRSTRNRIRPLEFWRGEKLLYGRIHDSLATVIGIKCSSPGNTTLKVKSYVSDDYADLVERASLH